jgi:hypothetical protein
MLNIIILWNNCVSDCYLTLRMGNILKQCRDRNELYFNGITMVPGLYWVNALNWPYSTFWQFLWIIHFLFYNAYLENLLWKNRCILGFFHFYIFSCKRVLFFIKVIRNSDNSLHFVFILICSYIVYKNNFKTRGSKSTSQC